MVNEILRQLRELNNYTQTFVAKNVLNISQPTYVRLEQNPSKITVEQARILAGFYKVSVDDLMSEMTPSISFKKEDSSNHLNNENEINNATERMISELIKGIKIMQIQNDTIINQNALLQTLLKELNTTMAKLFCQNKEITMN